MRYDFDTIIERRGTASLKWDRAEQLFGAGDLLPMWVADMDFAAPPEVIAALRTRVAHGVFGYTAWTPAAADALTGWFRDRHGWALDPEWLLFCPGIVTALDLLVRTFTEPGDGIIIQPPVYHPFRHVVARNGRRLAANPLLLDAGRYRMDFTRLDALARESETKMLLLCNPHNPGGRVWSRDELTRLGEICLANNILVISDEIHCDLVRPGYRHLPFGAISDDFLQHSITCLSPSKTFNLAGLPTATLVIADPGMRATVGTKLETAGLDLPNALGLVALEAAYRHGAAWLDQLRDYLEGNLALLTEFVRERLPGITIIEPEATYLVWLDCRGLGLTPAALRRALLERGKLALSDGYIFGRDEGSGFVRINIACPRAVLDNGLARLARALGEKQINHQGGNGWRRA